MQVRSLHVVLIAAAIGIALPIVVMTIDRLTDLGWWPRWILYVWPSSYILGATSGVKDLGAYLMIAISISINGLAYGYVGSLLFRWLGRRQ